MAIGFPLSLSEGSFTICLTPYNRKENVLIASLNKTFPSFNTFYFSFRLTARILLYSSPHRQDNTDWLEREITQWVHSMKDQNVLSASLNKTFPFPSRQSRNDFFLLNTSMACRHNYARLNITLPKKYVAKSCYLNIPFILPFQHLLAITAITLPQ